MKEDASAPYSIFLFAVFVWEDEEKTKRSPTLVSSNILEASQKYYENITEKFWEISELLWKHFRKTLKPFDKDLGPSLMQSETIKYWFWNFTSKI